MNKYNLPIAIGSIVSTFYMGYGISRKLEQKVNLLEGEQKRIAIGLTAVSILIVPVNKILEKQLNEQ